MWDVSRDLARRVAVGELSPLEAEQIALQALPGGSNYLVSVQDVPGPTGGLDVQVRITADTREIAVFGMLDLLEIEQLDTLYAMRKEL